MPSVFKAVLRISMVLSSFFGKVHGGPHSTPALQELTVPGWEMAEWKIALPAPQELSAPVGPPSQFCVQCKYTTRAAVVCRYKRKHFYTALQNTSDFK